MAESNVPLFIDEKAEVLSPTSEPDISNVVEDEVVISGSTEASPDSSLLDPPKERSKSSLEIVTESFADESSVRVRSGKRCFSSPPFAETTTFSPASPKQYTTLTNVQPSPAKAVSSEVSESAQASSAAVLPPVSLPPATLSSASLPSANGSFIYLPLERVPPPGANLLGSTPVPSGLELAGPVLATFVNRYRPQAVRSGACVSPKGSHVVEPSQTDEELAALGKPAVVKLLAKLDWEGDPRAADKAKQLDRVISSFSAKKRTAEEALKQAATGSDVKRRCRNQAESPKTRFQFDSVPAKYRPHQAPPQLKTYATAKMGTKEQMAKWIDCVYRKDGSYRCRYSSCNGNYAFDETYYKYHWFFFHYEGRYSADLEEQQAIIAWFQMSKSFKCCNLEFDCHGSLARHLKQHHSSQYQKLDDMPELLHRMPVTKETPKTNQIRWSKAIDAKGEHSGGFFCDEVGCNNSVLYETRTDIVEHWRSVHHEQAASALVDYSSDPLRKVCIKAVKAFIKKNQIGSDPWPDCPFGECCTNKAVPFASDYEIMQHFMQKHRAMLFFLIGWKLILARRCVKQEADNLIADWEVLEGDSMHIEQLKAYYKAKRVLETKEVVGPEKGPTPEMIVEEWVRKLKRNKEATAMSIFALQNHLKFKQQLTAIKNSSASKDVSSLLQVSTSEGHSGTSGSASPFASASPFIASSTPLVPASERGNRTISASSSGTTASSSAAPSTSGRAASGSAPAEGSRSKYQFYKKLENQFSNINSKLDLIVRILQSESRKN